MDYFQDRFHMGFTGAKVGGVFGSYVAANFISTPIAAIIMDKWGRRPAMISGSVMVIIGAVLATTATTLAQLIVGRFMLGFGISWSLAGGAYCMEISLPHWRGRCTGQGSYTGEYADHTRLFNGGYWQIPLILQCLCALLVVILCPFCPESPRFLMRAGREDEALAFLIKYHGGGDPDAPLVRLEYSEMKASIAADDHSAWYDYSVLWKTKARRWRTVQVRMIGCFSQYCGIGLAYFTTVLLKNAGVTATVPQLGYGLLFSGLCAIGSTLGAAVSDHLPRRIALTTGSLVMAAELAGFAAANAIVVRDENHGLGLNIAAGKAAIAFWMIFGFTFGFFVVAGEAVTTDMRAKGFALFNCLMTGMGLISTFAGPIALGTIGAWKYALVFVALDVVQAACWYFFGVEAQGRTIEELDWIYDQPNPVAASKKRD
ncbi:Lactose permease [Vanrija pseudolonga]|uniref:Lactose permease n=1 Tax=Vanrija pseudolonga TaxID=143232 RepID=A0AAF1BKU0_9TREE|nr:Lactose permease [Vanrija pseudolonga]